MSFEATCATSTPAPERRRRSSGPSPPKRVFTPTMKAGELVAWLKQEFDLGHGHSMAVWAAFKNNGWVHAIPPEDFKVDRRSRVAGEERAGPAPLVVFPLRT